MSEVKTCWEQAVQNLSLEREKIFAEKSAIEIELKQMKTNQNEIKSQFVLCQSELERALDLAADFKQKLDEDNQVKDDLQGQISATEATMQMLQYQLKQFQNKESEMLISQESLTNEVQSLSRKLSDALKDKG